MPFVVDDAEAFLDHALQINPAPAHHTVTLPIGPRLDQGLQLGLLCPVQSASWPRVLMIAQAIGSFGIEAMNPVSQCLAVHATYASRIRPAAPVTDRRQGQKPACDIRLPAARRKSPQVRGRIVIP
ncbi:hypothetical protein JCM25156A_31410 [Komagataeibacter kakiaceti JCM 25156]